MGKTFYSVRYYIMGSDHFSVKWFDNKKEAMAFSNQDLTDKPVAHHFTKPESIACYEDLVRFSK